MSRSVKSQNPYSILPRLAFLLCSAALIVLGYVSWRFVSQHRFAQRGVLYESPIMLPLHNDELYGVNTSLEQYDSDEDLQVALRLARDGGFRWVRQHFPWAQIEPRPGVYNWDPWDRVIAEVRREGLKLIAVLDTSPQWARNPVDADNLLAPPQYVTTYGLFVRAFAERYGEHVGAYEVWDQPNIHPHWGARAINPAEYVRLLRVAATQLRAADGDAIVLCAGLAPTVETSGRNMSEALFLRGVYEAGGRHYFDVVAAKSYGFWSGPDDRRVDAQVLNLSRVILLREEMVRQGDHAVPIWAVEFGWNSLPGGWEGQAPPWGTDDVDKQTARIAGAVERIRREWAWMGLLCWADLQPALPENDPRWGFALLDGESKPTALYSVLQEASSEAPSGIAMNQSRYFLQLGLVAGSLLVLTVAWVRLSTRVPWAKWSSSLRDAYCGSPEWVQWSVIGVALLAYYLLPWALPSLLALALAGALVSLRLDIGLAYLVFAVPFFLFPKGILGKSFSMVESLTLLCFATWCARCWRGGELLRSGRHLLLSTPSQIRAWLSSLSGLDWSVFAFVLLSAASLLFSTHLGVSLREFRVIIVEPALLYLLLRNSQLRKKQLMRLADALLLAGLAVAIIGTHQYFVSGDVIVVEGVRRMRGVYASPNNLSLLLGRIIPLAVSVLWLGRPPRRQMYGAALGLMLIGLFLTYSRGGWLLSLPAGLLTIGVLRGRRSTLLALAVIAACALLLLPLVGTERIFSLFELEQGTTFYRLRLWQAALAMIQDHPLTGVGLDNFLYLYPDYMLPEAWREPGLSHPHNVILDFWTRLGVGGVAILLWLMVGFYRVALRCYRRLPEGNARAIILGLIASMTAALAHGLIDNSYFLVDLAFVFFLTLGMVRAWPEPSGLAVAETV